jgi:hypothetical protein
VRSPHYCPIVPQTCPIVKSKEVLRAAGKLYDMDNCAFLTNQIDTFCMHILLYFLTFSAKYAIIWMLSSENGLSADWRQPDLLLSDDIHSRCSVSRQQKRGYGHGNV